MSRTPAPASSSDGATPTDIVTPPFTSSLTARTSLRATTSAAQRLPTRSTTASSSPPRQATTSWLTLAMATGAAWNADRFSEALELRAAASSAAARQASVLWPQASIFPVSSVVSLTAALRARRSMARPVTARRAADRATNRLEDRRITLVQLPIPPYRPVALPT